MREEPFGYRVAHHMNTFRGPQPAKGSKAREEGGD